MESKAPVATTQKALAPVIDMSKIEAVLITGDLAKLDSGQRVAYYNRVCESVGLNPLTRPFEYTNYEGRLILYARKDAAEQLRKIYSVSVIDLKKEVIGELLHVTAFGEDGIGRRDVGTGAVWIGGLKGKDLANAYMKAETKAKRRMTLSICGLGMLDESELDGAREVTPSKAEVLRAKLSATAEPLPPRVPEQPVTAASTVTQTEIVVEEPPTESPQQNAHVDEENDEPCWVKADVPYEDREQAKAAGFKWDIKKKAWTKLMTWKEQSELPFATVRLE